MPKSILCTDTVIRIRKRLRIGGGMVEGLKQSPFACKMGVHNTEPPLHPHINSTRLTGPYPSSCSQVNYVWLRAGVRCRYMTGYNQRYPVYFCSHGQRWTGLCSQCLMNVRYENILFLSNHPRIYGPCSALQKWTKRLSFRSKVSKAIIVWQCAAFGASRP